MSTRYGKAIHPSVHPSPSTLRPQKGKSLQNRIVLISEVSFGIIFHTFVPPFSILLLLQDQAAVSDELISDELSAFLRLSYQIIILITFLAVVLNGHRDMCIVLLPQCRTLDISICSCGSRRAHIVDMKLGSRVSFLTSLGLEIKFYLHEDRIFL